GLAALEYAELAAFESSRVVTALDAVAAGLDADQTHLRLLEKIEEEPDGVRATADTRDHLVRQPALGREDLLARLLADHAVKIAHHHRIRVRAERRAEDVVRAAHVRDPIAHRLVDRFLERLLAGLDAAHLGTHEPHAKHVQRLPLHVDRP